MILKEDVSKVAAKLANAVAFCGPLKVSCIDGKKYETNQISGFKIDLAQTIAEQMILEFLDKHVEVLY
jgi:hypothetical protein